MAKNVPSFEDVASKGFVFPGARDWIDRSRLNRLAQDAALISTPNTGVPVELTAYIDPAVVEILTAVRNARAIFPEVKKGDWTTSYDKWGVEELTGSVQPYTDYADGGTSGVNFEWFAREQFVFQTTITWGDLELDVSSAAKIDLAAQKQRAAATIIDTAANKFYLRGVAGKEIYGLLNDPNLPAATAVSSWSAKNAEAIYNDIVTELFKALVDQAGGHVTPDSPLKLLLSPSCEVYLGKANSYGKTAKEMLGEYFTNLTYVTLPELESAAGDTMFLVATNINGLDSGELPFGVKLKASRVVPELSAYSQKFVSSTYGGLVKRPFAFASIYGMDASI